MTNETIYKYPVQFLTCSLENLFETGFVQDLLLALTKKTYIIRYFQGYFFFS